MVLGTRKGLDPGVEMNIQIEQDQLKVTYSFRYLGLTIDSHLSWKQHITQLIETVSPKIALANRVNHRFLSCQDLANDTFSVGLWLCCLAA